MVLWKKKKSSKYYDNRTRVRFAFFPTLMFDKHDLLELVWLCKYVQYDQAIYFWSDYKFRGYVTMSKKRLIQEK